MITPGLREVMKANEAFIMDWGELERFLSYEIFNSVGEQQKNETYRIVHEKMREIKGRREKQKKKTNYRVFGRNTKDDMMLYLQDNEGHTTQAFSLRELNLAWTKGALPQSVTFDELLSLSPFEWRTLIDKIELGFARRPLEDGECYGAISALVE